MWQSQKRDVAVNFDLVEVRDVITVTRDLEVEWDEAVGKDLVVTEDIVVVVTQLTQLCNWFVTFLSRNILDFMYIHSLSIV